jgi:aspartate racemase
VSIVHQGIVRLVLNANYVEWGNCEALLQLAPLTFDASTFEIWGALLSGSRLVISPVGPLSLSEIARVVQIHQVTTLWLTAGLFHQMVEQAVGLVRSGQVTTTSNHKLEQLECVRQLLAGGEVLSVSHVKQMLGTLGEGRRLINGYGPTENTTFTCCHVMDRESSVENSVSIGCPITRTQVYVLDDQLQLVPLGVVGELYAGGDGLARGYFNRPDLTAERFIPHPFAGCACPGPCTCPQPGARLYRTGDQVRYRADGTLEYLGRIDQQVKLRGFRIEPGEIEATLRRHPTIQECVVLVREDMPGEKQLVAYAAVCQGQTFIASDLRSYLQDRLPAYMIPATFVPLDALPKLSNGKVNRHALVQEPRPGPAEDRTVVAPRTPIEKALVAIWTDLLNLEQVSISDNFFEVGGHSLLAVQLLNRMNKQFGSSGLSLSKLFQVPTIEQAAALLQKEVRELPARASQVTSSPCVSIQHAGEKTPFFCVHDGTGGVYWSLNLAKHLRHDRPLYGIQAPGLVGSLSRANPDQDLFYSIEEMAAFYIDELLTIQPDGPYFIGGYSFGGLVAFELARQLQTQGSSVALLAILDSYPRAQNISTPVEVVGTGLAPVPVPTAPVRDYAGAIVRIAEDVSRSWKKKVSVSYEALCPLQPDEQLVYFLDRLRDAQIAPDDMDIFQLRRYIQVYEAHESCLQRYRPKPYPGRITLFCSEDGEADPSSWSPFSSEPVEVHPVSGDHLSMVDEPYVQSLALQLQRCLDKADVL